MKTQDKITQVYQNAFKDYAVEAPASLQAGALKQLGRNSLLTIDPSRFNVFYLALLSGAIAWAILGSTSEELVQESSSNQLEFEKVENSYVSKKADKPSIYESENIMLQEESGAESKLNLEEDRNKYISSPEINNSKGTKSIDLNRESTAELRKSKHLFKEKNKSEPILEADNALIPERIDPIKVDLESEILDLVDPVSLSGAKIQPVNSLMRQLKLDSDDEVTLSIYKNK